MMRTLHVITSERNGQKARELGGGDIAGAVYFTSPQNFYNNVSYSVRLNKLEDFYH